MIHDLKSLKQHFRKIKTPILGAGVYAFNRLGLEQIAKPYRLLALRHSLDTQLIEKEVETFSLEKGMGLKHIQEPRNATTVLKLPRTKQYLSQFNSPAILVQKSSDKMEKICRDNNWRLMANPAEFGKKMIEDKIKFRKMLQELDVKVAPGKISSVDNLHYGHLINKYGLPFVIQHPTRGGGKGTFFINNQQDFQKALAKLKQKYDPENEKSISPPEQVLVAKYIQGSSPSITGCVTRQGILSTNLQHQVLDIPELYSPEKGSGLFCGHDWTSSNFSQSIQEQAYQAAEKIGRHFQSLGYRGIFGLDFIFNPNEKQLYPIECNPRLLGSFPTINMAQLLNNEPPIIAFHVLEFLSQPYQLDKGKINRLIRQKKKGAQMILHNLSGRWARNQKQIQAGVYKLKSNRLRYLRPGYDLKHLKNPEEFLLADGVPFKGSHFSPNRRLCRILTLERVLDNSFKNLNPWAKQVSQAVYQAFALKPIRWIKLKKFFKPNLLAKG